MDRSVRLGARVRLAFVDLLRDPVISLFARLGQLELIASVRSAGLFART